MLILTRRIGEGLTIGDGVRVVVLEVRGKQVRLGIEAPADMGVLRDEIFQRLVQENRQAADFQLSDLEKVNELAGSRFVSPFRPPEPPPEVPRLAIHSGKLGMVQIPEDQIITCSQGLLGLDGVQRYALLSPPQPSPFLLLQCLDQPALSLVVVELSALGADFQLGRIGSALKELDAENARELQVFAILTIPPGRPEEATANLVSPILVNPRRRLAKQVVLGSPQHSHKHRILPD